jgi:hypothetical protein
MIVYLLLLPIKNSIFLKCLIQSFHHIKPFFKILFSKKRSIYSKRNFIYISIPPIDGKDQCVCAHGHEIEVMQEIYYLKGNVPLATISVNGLRVVGTSLFLKSSGSSSLFPRLPMAIIASTVNASGICKFLFKAS